MASEPVHCDDYINDSTASMPLRWFLFIHRLPAAEKLLCVANGVLPKLYADYRGKRVRVVMASRLGDVGITENLDEPDRYRVRVAVNDLQNFAGG